MEQHGGVQFTHFQNSFEIAEHLHSMILFCLLIMLSSLQVNDFSEFAVESKISFVYVQWTLVIVNLVLSPILFTN